MKKLQFLSIFSLLLIGTFLFVSCEKQDDEMLTEEADYASTLKASGGYALYFDGFNDMVRVPDDPTLDLTDAFTIAAWINIEEYVEWASILTKGGYTQDPDGNWFSVNNYAIHQSGDMLDPNVYDFGNLRLTGDNDDYPYPSFLESETKMELNTWYFVAVTWDGEYLKFYLNGELDGVHELGGTFTPNDVTLFIGVDFPGGWEFWKGMIDEVRIWNEALKHIHIKAAMKGHATPLGRALVGYWRFDEGEGDMAYDRSPNKNHGILGWEEYFPGSSPTWVSPGAGPPN